MGTQDAAVVRRAAFRGVVAIDGPSGTGKSTVSRQLAVQLGTRYLDTGAMYRAATLAVLRHRPSYGDAQLTDIRAGRTPTVSLDDTQMIVSLVKQAKITISTDPTSSQVSLDGQRVDSEIRSPEVTAAVSAISAIDTVRTLLVAAQRELIGSGGIVVEGRDIGTVVWPSARPKVYLTANAGVRARRRADQLGENELVDVAAGLARRDQFDSTRAVSPLVAAADAVEVDTTELSVDEVVQRLVDMTMAVASCG